MASAMRNVLTVLSALVLICAPIACDSKLEPGAQDGTPAKDGDYAQAIANRAVDVNALAAMTAGMTEADCLARLHTLGRHEITCSGGKGEVIAIRSVFIYATAEQREDVDLPMVW